jgi:hypothetical protein
LRLLQAHIARSTASAQVEQQKRYPLCRSSRVGLSSTFRRSRRSILKAWGDRAPLSRSVVPADLCSLLRTLLHRGAFEAGVLSEKEFERARRRVNPAAGSIEPRRLRNALVALVAVVVVLGALVTLAKVRHLWLFAPAIVPTRTVQLEATGPSGYSVPATLVWSGMKLGTTNVTLPWAWTGRLHPGTYVSFTVGSLLGSSIVTCVVESAGRIVATASASGGNVAVCAGNV